MATSQRILHPAWRDELQATPYPFGDWATLRNSNDVFIPEGTFLDAALYPIGGGSQLRLSKVVVAQETITLFIGDQIDDELCSGTLNFLEPVDELALVDAYGRAAGILVSTSQRLIIFQTMPPGTHTFTFAQTGFAAHVCIPVSDDYFRGFLLDDGSIVSGDIWLIGDDGIVLSHEEVDAPQDDCEVALGQDPTEQRIRIDIVGDPLFRQRLCANAAVTPKFLQTLTFKRGCDTVVVRPNAQGDIQMSVGRPEAESTILRLQVVDGTLKLTTIGERLST